MIMKKFILIKVAILSNFLRLNFSFNFYTLADKCEKRERLFSTQLNLKGNTEQGKSPN